MSPTREQAAEIANLIRRLPADTAIDMCFINMLKHYHTGISDGIKRADDLISLLDSLRIDRVHLVGTAAGAFVPLDFAISYPERLRSLVVANTIGGVQDPEFLEMGNRIRPPQFAALPPEVREVGPSYRAANPEGVKAWRELEDRQSYRAKARERSDLGKAAGVTCADSPHCRRR